MGAREWLYFGSQHPATVCVAVLNRGARSTNGVGTRPKSKPTPNFAQPLKHHYSLPSRVATGDDPCLTCYCLSCHAYESLLFLYSQRVF